jgi:hypothetical protein
MYVVAIPIPDEMKLDLLNAFAAQYGYAEQVPSPDNPNELVPNPISIEQHLEDRIGFFMIDVVSAYLISAAERQARAAAETVVHAKIADTIMWFNTLRQAREEDGAPLFGGDQNAPGAQSSPSETTDPFSFTAPDGTINYKELAQAKLEARLANAQPSASSVESEDDEAPRKSRKPRSNPPPS